MKTKINSGFKAKVLNIVFIVFGIIVILGCNNSKNEKELINNQTVLQDTITKSIVEDVFDGEVFDVVDEMPVFGSTPNALNEYIASHVRYPDEAKENGIQGKVYVSFVVTKTGNVADVKVANFVNEFLDAEAIRVISAMPNWTPGKINGEAVNVKFNIPINFKLN
ncbi:MAG: energy transducer TonB [Bacteroidales bacterium]|nr:energy transducer TonB [Bacteroidales bacterium]